MNMPTFQEAVEAAAAEATAVERARCAKIARRWGASMRSIHEVSAAGAAYTIAAEIEDPEDSA